MNTAIALINSPLKLHCNERSIFIDCADRTLIDVIVLFDVSSVNILRHAIMLRLVFTGSSHINSVVSTRVDVRRSQPTLAKIV